MKQILEIYRHFKFPYDIYTFFDAESEEGIADFAQQLGDGGGYIYTFVDISPGEV